MSVDQPAPPTGRAVLARHPGEAQTVREMFQYAVETFADRVAFRRKLPKGYSTWTYKDVHDYVRRFSGALLEMGVKKGDRIVILSDNRPEWGVAYFSITSIGAIAVPLDRMLSLGEIANLLAHSGARFAVAPASFTVSLREVFDRAPCLEKILSMEEPNGDGILVGYEDMLESGERSGRDYSEVDIGPEDVLTIVYTSGTTGTPKGVMITHSNIAFECNSLNLVNPYSSDDVLLSLLPMNHLYEFMAGFLGPFVCGGQIGYISSLLPSRILEALKDFGVTRLVGVPLLFTLFYEEVGTRVAKLGGVQKFLFFRSMDIARSMRTSLGYSPGKVLFKKIHDAFGGCLRQAIVGGARMDADMVDRILDAGFPLYVGYGLTETSPVSTFGEAGSIPRKSVGKAIPGVEIRIADPAADGTGEILIRGGNVMKGYFKDPERTAQVLRDGWFHTGDLGYVDPQGYLFLTGRIKEMIVTHGGKKLFPEDLENHYASVDHVKEFCVVGQPSKDGKGEEPVAVIVADRDAPDSPRDPSALERTVRASFAQRTRSIPAYQALKNLVFVNGPLPKTTTFKVKRSEVAQLLSTQQLPGGPMERRRKERLQVTVLTTPQVDLAALKNLLDGDPATAGRSQDKLQKALEQSTVVLSVLSDGQLVGFARGISDGAYGALVTELVVHPKWRRKGIGSLLMSRVLTHPAFASASRIVGPGQGPTEFLERFGFARPAAGSSAGPTVRGS